MYKPAEARPSAANIVARLALAGEQATSPGASRLAQVNSAEAERLARDYAEAVQKAEEEKTAAALFEVAKQSFDSVVQSLRATIEADAPLALFTGEGHGSMEFVVKLQTGKLGLGRPQHVPSWDGPFQLIASAVISVNQDPPNRGYRGRSHNLWYCDAHEKGRFAWYEMAFMSISFSSSTIPDVDPYSVDPSTAIGAFRPAVGGQQLAWPVEELDRADLSEFVDRWIGWFADSASGSMQHPSRMPEKDISNCYRQA